MQADPNYLTENKIRVIDKAGNEVPPTAINWNSMEAVNYRFRQDPGADVNSLGVVRIDIANPYGVYMHDTPAKGVFGDDFRFVSSGCIRLQNVRDYVAFLLRETPGWDREAIDRAIASGERIDVKINPAVPVYWVYVTAWANDGIVQFREDIYEKDKLGLALNEVGDTAGTLAALEQAVQLDPAHSTAWYNLGLGYNAQNRPGDALGALQRAIAAEPNAARFHYARATILLRLNRRDEARQALRATQMKKAGGGTGFSFSRLRPEGDRVQAELAQLERRLGRDQAIG